MNDYPADAYSPSGKLWWQLSIWPGTKKSRYGAEPKLAAWLMFNVKKGDVFTIRQLRDALGNAGDPNDDEHFNRRFRNLRKYGWALHSQRDAIQLRQDEYPPESYAAPVAPASESAATESNDERFKPKS